MRHVGADRAAREQERLGKIKSLEAALQQEEMAFRQDMAQSRTKLAGLKVRPGQRERLRAALGSLEAARPGRVPYGRALDPDGARNTYHHMAMD